MSSWDSLNASTTASSVGTCAGSSPAPRQQNQLIVTTSPVPPSDSAGPLASGSSDVVPPPPQAARTRARIANGARTRFECVRMGGTSIQRFGDSVPPVDLSAMGDLLHDDSIAVVPVAGSGELWQERSRPARPKDAPLDVVARAVAAHEGPGELDRLAVRGERDALDDQRRRPRLSGEQLRLARTQQHRLDRLPRAHDHRAIALGEHVVEGVALEIDLQQSGEPMRRQPGALQQERLTVGHPEPLKEGEGRTERDTQGPGGGFSRRLDAGPD